MYVQQNIALDRLIMLHQNSTSFVSEADDIWMRSEIEGASRTTHKNPEPSLIPTFETICVESHLKMWRKMGVEPKVQKNNLSNLKSRLQINERR